MNPGPGGVVHRLLPGSWDLPVGVETTLCGAAAGWPDLLTSRGDPTCPACCALRARLLALAATAVATPEQG